MSSSLSTLSTAFTLKKYGLAEQTKIISYTWAAISIKTRVKKFLTKTGENFHQISFYKCCFSRNFKRYFQALIRCRFHTFLGAICIFCFIACHLFEQVVVLPKLSYFENFEIKLNLKLNHFQATFCVRNLQSKPS